MNRTHRRALKQLPRSLSPWEVLLAPMPEGLTDAENQGILIVCDAQTGELRALGPLLPDTSIWSVLTQAFSAPSEPCVPAQPRSLRCMDPGLAASLKSAVQGLGLPVELVAALPAAQAAIDGFLKIFAPQPGPAAPGLSVEPAKWALALEELTQLAPWEDLSNSMTFRFRGSKALGTSVAVLIGNSGEQRGVIVYPTEWAYLSFRKAAISGVLTDSEAFFALNLYLDPTVEFSPQELQACQAAGLVTSSGLCPRFMVLDKGQPRLAKPGEQLSMLAVVQAISALCKGALVDLELVPAARPVRTQLGTIQVMSSPSPVHVEHLPPPIFEGECGIHTGRLMNPDTGEFQDALILKLRKKQAQSLAKKLQSLDRLELQPDYSLFAFQGDRLMGRLLDPDPEMLMKLVAKDRLTLCVSAGGPSRVTIKQHEFVMMKTVRLGVEAESVD
ncbi:MAG: hypothetical protein ACI9VR_005046 [Cognaticolwellia sp.]|jgi:hypothetical protein